MQTGYYPADEIRPITWRLLLETHKTRQWTYNYHVEVHHLDIILSSLQIMRKHLFFAYLTNK